MQRPGRARLRLDHLTDDFESLATERPNPGQQFIEDHTQAPQVAPRIGQVALALGLLGAHISWRAHQSAFSGEQRFAVGLAGQSKVHDQRLAVLAEHDVFWLDIPVDDPPAVCVVQGFGQLANQNACFADRVLRPLGEPLTQSPTGNVTGGYVTVSVGHAGIVDRYDVGML